MFKQIKRKIQQYSLKKKAVQNRHIKATNLSKAKSVGILVELTDENSLHSISLLRDEIKKQHLKINVLFYFDKKEMPFIAENPLSMPVLTKKDQNFWGVPNSENLVTFWKEQYDLFIDLSLHPSFLSRYIAAGTNASFRVGMHTNENIPYYDFLIKLKPAETPALEVYIQYIFNYLKTINP